jgi:hypothetical protein
MEKGSVPERTGLQSQSLGHSSMQVTVQTFPFGPGTQKPLSQSSLERHAEKPVPLG